MWTDALSDDCTCKWRNHKDNGGWELRHRNPSCPDHGDAEQENDKETP